MKNTAQNQLSIRQVRLRDCQIKIDEQVRPYNASEKTKSRFGFQGVSNLMQTTANADGMGRIWVYIFNYTVGVKCSEIEETDLTSDDELPELIEILANFEAEYVSSEEVGEACLDEFAEGNVGYHVWPYWREFVQNSLARMQMPHDLVTVPFYFVEDHNKSPDSDADSLEVSAT